MTHQNEEPILIYIFYIYTVWLTQKYALPSASCLEYSLSPASTTNILKFSLWIIPGGGLWKLLQFPFWYL